MWDRRVQEKLEDMVGTFFVLVRWQGMVDGFIWACLGVYGPNENSERGVKFEMSWYSAILEFTVVLHWGFQYCTFSK